MAKNDTTPTRTRTPRSAATTTTTKTTKTTEKPAAAAPSDLLAFDPAAPAFEVTVTTLTKPDQALLRRTMRFLVNVLEPGLADRARREGYSRAEHALGWQLWRTAAGETRPFEHWLREQELVAGLDNEEQRRRLTELDEFENTWFPRTRAIIRRVVKKDRRDAFAAAFFKDLVQQPLGPAVVGSVGTFLARLAGLDTSTDPDAKVVRTTLAARGLTPGKLAAIQQLIDDTTAGATGSAAPTPPVSAAELEKARLAQRGALEALRDWWNDWSVTLRPRYGIREQLKLGLTTSKKRGPSSEGEGELDGELEDELEDDASTGDALAGADALVTA